MARTLIIRKPVASFESVAMPDDLYAEQVAEHAVESNMLDQSVEQDIEESETTVASLESRMEALDLLASFAGKPIHSFEQASLTMAVAYGAVQGTDLDIHADVLGKTQSQVTESFESEAGLVYSAEAIGQTLKDMASAVGEKLKQAGKWLYELVVKIFNMFRGKETRVKNLRSMIDKAKTESKAKAGDEIRLTGSQVANVGTVGEYSEMLKVFSMLNGANPKFVELLTFVEAAAVATKVQVDKEKGEINVDRKALDGVIRAADSVVTSYTSIFKLKFVAGKDDEMTATSPLVGKKKIKITKNAVTAITSESGVDAIRVSDHIQSMKFSLVKDENTPESMMAPVLTVDELGKLVTDIEQAISGKVIALKTLENIAKHRLFEGNVVEKFGGTEQTAKLGRELTAMSRIVRDSVVMPHGLLTSTFQSVTDDYLRYAERSAKFHLSGQTAANDDKSEGADAKVEDNLPAVV